MRAVPCIIEFDLLPNRNGQIDPHDRIASLVGGAAVCFGIAEAGFIDRNISLIHRADLGKQRCGSAHFQIADLQVADLIRGLGACKQERQSLRRVLGRVRNDRRALRVASADLGVGGNHLRTVARCRRAGKHLNGNVIKSMIPVQIGTVFKNRGLSVRQLRARINPVCTVGRVGIARVQ